MRQRLTAAAAVALLLLGSFAPVASASATIAATTNVPARSAIPESVSRTDQVIVRWATSVAAAAKPGPARIDHAAELSAIRSVAAAAAGAKIVRSTSAGVSIYRLSAPLGVDAPRTLAALNRLPGVISVEADLWITPDSLPNDPLASQLWGLLGLADGSPYGIDARAAWPTTTGTGVTVGVIDTGVRFNHPDLIGQTVPGYDMISNPTVARDGNGRDPDASDPGDPCQGEPSSWHGTHVAGTIAALANNSVGVFGGAPGVKIEPIRAIGMCGGYESDVADAIIWAAGGSVSGVPANPHPARVLNLSLSAPDTACPSYFASAIASARARGAVVVVAAGNESVDAGLDTPANCPAALTVAAVDSNGRKPDFSNYGAHVDLAGPGVGIWSTVDTGTNGPVGPSYAAYDGTSMATPHVALSAALLAAAYPSLSPDAIEFVLRSTATPVATDASAEGCPARGCGAGIVNAGRAVTTVAGSTPLVGSVASTVHFPRPGALITVTALAIAGAGVAGAERRIDGGAWTAMSASDGSFGGASETVSATITAPLAEGGHTICVRATDLDAHTSAGTTCTSIVVDAGPPVVTTPVLTPATAGQGAPVGVTSSATDGLAVTAAQVRVDGGAWTAMTAGDGSFGGPAEGLAATVAVSTLGQHAICVRAMDGATNTSDGTACATLTVIDTAPPIATPPTQALGTGTTIGRTTVPIRLTWSGTDPGGAVARYELARSTNDGPFVAISLETPTATSSTRALPPGTNRYGFRVRAIDTAGNVGDWAYGPEFQVRLIQDTAAAIHYTGAWVGSHASAASGTHLRSTTAHGASARTTFTGRAVAWVAPRGPTRGSAKIYVDGVFIRTVSLHAAISVSRRVVFSRSWATAGRHTIKIVCQATSGHRRIDIDTIVVLQ